MDRFDIIIVGAGASGLLLADALCADRYFAEHRILLLEKGDKQANDRTWCFWEKGNGAFDHLLHASWNQLKYCGQETQKTTAIHPYTYKMIRGADFYAHYLNKLQKASNLTYLQAAVLSMEENESEVSLRTDKGDFQGKHVFSSIYDPGLAESQQRYPVLKQHFLGWRVRTEEPFFDPDTATLMDFSIPQKKNTRFMYVLPFSEKEALLEYTLFSPELLEKREYETALEEYLEQMGVINYTIEESEYGVIPMTCYPFQGPNEHKRLHPIGISGGWAKPSTGYTFMNSYRKSREIVANLKAGRGVPYPTRNRFWWYDLWMLDFLWKHNERGHELFSALFGKREAQLIFKFLDEETSFREELELISACPKRSLSRIALQRILNWPGSSGIPRTA